MLIIHIALTGMTKNEQIVNIKKLLRDDGIRNNL